MKRILCLLCAAGLTHAGETVELSANSPRDAKVPGTLRIARVEAEVTMRGVLAETKATLTLAMDADPARKMEGRLLFPLPPECVITGAALDIGDTMRPASVTFKETAARAYQSVVSRMLDPCLVQLQPDGRVSVQVFPFQHEKPRKLRLEFAQTVPPGTVWRFPLQFAAPVPEAVLKADAPVVLGTERRENFTGDWTFTAPVGVDDLAAHPDGAGHRLFQTLLPPGELVEPPHHLLVLADVSLMQAQRDAAAEKAFLERIFHRMQNGSVTLVTFSTMVHGRNEFAVQDGKCEALFAALGAMQFDGAPRPGAVDVSGIPAELTVVLSTLHAPLGGGMPRLPAHAPVWVLDSVSKTPSGAARWLAAEAGGEALDPRRTLEIAFRKRPVVSSLNLTGLRFHPLSEGGFLLTGELTGESGELTVRGKTRRITRGPDAIAGPITARERDRALFLRLTEESRALLQTNLRAGKNAAPFLSETTALIVLEDFGDYQRFGIPLPPDLAGDKSHAPTATHDDRAGLTEYQQALRRPAGTVGDPAPWHARVESWDSRQALGEAYEKKFRFEEHRQGSDAPPARRGWGGWDDRARPGSAKGNEAVAALTRLSRAYQEASAGSGEKVIRQGRAEQQKIMTEILNENFDGQMLGLRFHSGADPFASPTDSFAAPSASTGPGFGFVSGAGSGGAAATETLAVAGPTTPAPVPDPVAAAPQSSPPVVSGAQVPQTFGGGGTGGLFGGSGFSTSPVASTEPFLPERQKTADTDPTPPPLRTGNILARATRLHGAGRQAEAVRALSVLAIAGPDDPARLRLLAWRFQEWGEPALALEVLSEAEARFGESETTLRDRGLATLAAGRKEEALQYLRRVLHHVTWRDVAGLEGRMDAALRVVVECASGHGDVNLEIEGPDYELCSWRNPLPAFGGALSFDGRGEAPEDFVLPALPARPLQVRFRLSATGPQSVRVIIVENWGRPEAKQRVILFPLCQPGRTDVVQIPAAAK